MIRRRWPIGSTEEHAWIVDPGNGGDVSDVVSGPRAFRRPGRRLHARCASSSAARLESAGFDVVGEGGDGDEAILLAYRHEPALLLLDTSMPKVDGIEALPAILALSPSTRVVMFTGFEEHGLAVRARELGAADFVEKSILLEDLPERLLGCSAVEATARAVDRADAAGRGRPPRRRTPPFCSGTRSPSCRSRRS